jgi:hypothetical protein
VSERKGGAHKKERRTLNLDIEDHARLMEYAQRKKLKMSVILAEFIEKGVEHDIYDPKWIEKLISAQKILNGFASMDKGCGALAFGKKKSGEGVYRCVWYNPGKPPSIKILGETESLMKSACQSCDVTKDIREGLAQKDTRIKELEAGLDARSREVYKIPLCRGGALLNDDATIFSSCRKSSVPVSIEKYCKVLSSGLPCGLYAESVIGLGEKA